MCMGGDFSLSYDIILIRWFALQKIMYFISLVLENIALSSDDNEDLIYCLKVNFLSFKLKKVSNVVLIYLWMLIGSIGKTS